MAHYFRQLLLPVVLVSVAMLCVTVLWYQHEAELQRKLQIQQLSAALQISLRPYLSNAGADQLQAHLKNAQYASLLPVQAIAIYDQRGEIIAATSDTESLKKYQPPLPLNNFTLMETEHHQLVAVQPLAALPAAFSFYYEPARVAENYYLLMVLSKESQYSFWLVPAGSVSLLGVVVLLIVHAMLRRVMLRQHTDISLLSHKLQQLQHGQLDSRISEELVAEFQPLKQSFNALAEQKETDLNLLNRKLSEQQQRLMTYQEEQNQARQQLSNVTQNLHSASLTLESWLKNCQVLLQQSSLSESEILRLLQSQITLAQQQLAQALPASDIIDPVSWFSQQLSGLQGMLSPVIQDVNLIEGADNPLSQLHFPEVLLSQLLQALLQVSIQQQGVSELTLRFITDNTSEPAALRLSITTNGQGMPARTRQLLQSADTTDLQWYEADIAVAAVLAKRLSAQVHIQSLDGLGCTFQINIPVSMKPVAARTDLQHLLVFDADQQRLSERKTGLSAMAMQCVFCSDIKELELRSKQFLYDAIIIFLPDVSTIPLLQPLLNKLAIQAPMQCYARIADYSEWERALPNIPVKVLFCLAQVYQLVHEPPHFHPVILVVDDNTTNLAFVKALLKNHPVQVVTAASATEAMLVSRQRRFDLVLLDIQLPDLPGTDVARHLRQMPEYRDIPILAFTAHALNEEIAAFYEAGMDDVILKPLEPSKLPDILKWCKKAVQ
ncbi:response regulator [Chromatiaceae bacterium AAb-1]|nr:response regulator [Chromatiaceae bacterium AAb-1]